MPVGALIVGGAGIVGAGITAGASKSAAKTQANAANNAAQMQMQMFQTIRGDLAPYRSFGGGALPGLSALLGYGGGSGGTAGTEAVAPTQDWAAYLQKYPDVAAEYQQEATRDAKSKANLAALGITTPEEYAAWHYNTMGQQQGFQVPMTAGSAAVPGTPGTGGGSQGIQAMLESLPGYQFTKQQGLQAVTNRLAAQGLGGSPKSLSGAYGKGIARFVTGLADTTFGEQVKRLQDAASMGQNAAVQTGTAGQNATTGATNALIGGANASAAGTVGAANAYSGGINNAANAFLGNRLLGMYGGAGAAPSVSGGIPAAFDGLY